MLDLQRYPQYLYLRNNGFLTENFLFSHIHTTMFLYCLKIASQFDFDKEQQLKILDFKIEKEI